MKICKCNWNHALVQWLYPLSHALLEYHLKSIYVNIDSDNHYYYYYDKEIEKQGKFIEEKLA